MQRKNSQRRTQFWNLCHTQSQTAKANSQMPDRPKISRKLSNSIHRTENPHGGVPLHSRSYCTYNLCHSTQALSIHSYNTRNNSNFAFQPITSACTARNRPTLDQSCSTYFHRKKTMTHNCSRNSRTDRFTH